MNKVLQEDLQLILTSNVDFSQFKDKTILITGATGLIGSILVKSLLYANEIEHLNLTVIAVVRDIERAKNTFKDFADSALTYSVADLSKQTVTVEGNIDYIIHGASQTSSKAFVAEPVETIQTAYNGTLTMLNLAREKQVKSFVYLSSMEVYGSPKTDEKITEEHSTNLNTTSVRSSYPEGKRICEMLCTAFASEYNVPTKIVRLTQTLGPGFAYNDKRIVAEFARCAIEKRNIILHTKGETKRCCLYTADAATAILTILLKGKNSEAYNAANEETYCSIYEMAQLVAKECAKDEISVEIQLEDENKLGYAPTLKMNLSSQKLERLGWEPKIDLMQVMNKIIKAL
jgi:nucleoside-diphosphate-sugar epimerase